MSRPGEIQGWTSLLKSYRELRTQLLRRRAGCPQLQAVLSPGVIYQKHHCPWMPTTRGVPLAARTDQMRPTRPLCPPYGSDSESSFTSSDTCPRQHCQPAFLLLCQVLVPSLSSCGERAGLNESAHISTQLVLQHPVRNDFLFPLT